MTNDSYTKILNENLKVSLAYGEVEHDFQNCTLTFENTSKDNIIINPKDNSNQSWFNIFGSKNDEALSKLHIDENLSQPLKLFIGKIQLFGYVVLNYNFNFDTSTLEVNNYSQWWNNKEYLNQYFHKEEFDKGDDDSQWKLNLVAFIQQHQNNKMIINGKLGGVNELIIDNNENKLTNNMFLLNDLIGMFNCKPKSKQDIELSLQEVIDSIIPIYSTSQSLLFTDLLIEKDSSKLFQFKFSVNDDLPPSYNTRSTGSACDQGWISIRYSLIVSLIEDQITNQPKSIYFPYYVKPKRYGLYKHYQKCFFTNDIELDKNWRIYTEESNGFVNGMDTDANKSTFIQDLSSLIDSDLYNMPKISTNERRKSSVKIGIDEEFDHSYVSQLPKHLKTQYQLRVNNQELCLINISKPYYHLGEDINFMVDINSLNTVSTKITGIICYIEAHEHYHLEDGSIYTNPIKVTSHIKINTFSPSIMNEERTLVNDYLNIPKYLTPQFQTKSLMDLKYFLVFQFNLIEEEKEIEHSQEENSVSNENKADKFTTHTDLFSPDNTTFKFDRTGSTYKFNIPLYIFS